VSGGRYEGSATQTYVSPGGITVTYLALRMPPAPAPAGATTTIAVDEVNRLDLVAYRTLHNALLAWRIADANEAMNPFELCAQAGTLINVPGAGL
jgi:hypothetical protein